LLLFDGYDEERPRALDAEVVVKLELPVLDGLSAR
jgi:hypothetical protein